METALQIPSPHGIIDGLAISPAEAPKAAIILFMDVWGLRQELYDIARDLAAQGYYCLVPNTYFRYGPVRFDHRDEAGRMLSIEVLSPDIQEEVRRQMRLLTDEMLVEDVGVMLDYLDASLGCTTSVGAIGYCMGGRHALLAAAYYPERVHAAASLHGTRLATDSPHSPHRLTERMRGEVYCGFAERDSLAPPATIEALAAAFKMSSTAYTCSVHPGTVHGYALPDRDIYDAEATNRDWRFIMPMLARCLDRQSEQKKSQAFTGSELR
jgi:carboxymethylenebutenolidase